MVICRALAAAAIVALTLQQAGAQFGGMPGIPGGPAPGGGGFGGSPPAAPPPFCQELLKIRDEVQKHGQAIEAANQKRATVQVACRLFKSYLSAEARMLKALVTIGPKCGVPPQIAEQVKGSHATASKVGKQVCDAAARGPAGPSLSDALGTAPQLPKAGDKKGSGTFETLTGNPFER